MNPWPLSIAFPATAAFGVVLILAYDAVSAALAARRPGFRYGRLWPAQFALYVLVGFVGAFALLDPRLVGVLGAIVGCADATLGWAITWRIGPGRVAGATRARIAGAVVSVTAMGFGCALAGAFVFTLFARAVVHGR